MPSFDGKRPAALAGTALAAALVLLAPARASAHFAITAPTTPPQPATVQSWMSEDSMGGPQKNGPCAATPNTKLGDSAGTPVANAVTVVQAGQTVTIPVTVTIAHPGWFRIALAQGASSTQTLTALPDPVAMSGTNCTPAIMSNPVWSPTQPILADGLPAGSTASTNQSGKKTFTVTIPSTASCSMAQPCSLQVVMVMTDHPVGDCYYHHCADVAVSSGTSAGGSSGAAGASAAGGAGGVHGGTGGSGTGGSATGGAVGTGGTGTGGIEGTGGGTGTGGTGTVSTGGTGGSSSTGTGGTHNSTGGQPGGTTSGSGGSSSPGDSSSSGCSIAVGSDRAGWLFGAAGLVALVLARRRRRR
jgi:MYXO-CTERM domain-containing protein